MVARLVANKTGWSEASTIQTVCNYMEEVFSKMKITDPFKAAEMICSDFGF